MKLVIAIVGLILTAAWIEQVLTIRSRKRRERDRAHAKWWKEPDDGSEGDY